jgi:hypothetical protein
MDELGTNRKAKMNQQSPMIKTSGQIYEYACREGNYGMLNTLRGERVIERETAAESGGQ